MPKYLDSFITNFLENMLAKSKYLAKTVIFLVSNKII